MPEEISTELEVQIKSDIKKYDVPDAMIESLAFKFSSLKIQSVDDRTGYEAVSAARKEVKRIIAGVESKRKELKSYALNYGKAIDAEASRITSKLEEVMLPLQQMEVDYEREKERLKREFEEAHRKKIQDRVEKMQTLNVPFDFFKISIMPDPEFDAYFASEKERSEQIEKERIERERIAEESRKVENDRLEAERKRQAEETAKINAQLAEERRKREEAEKELELKKREELERAAALAAQNKTESPVIITNPTPTLSNIDSKEKELADSAKKTADHLEILHNKEKAIETDMLKKAEQENKSVNEIPIKTRIETIIDSLCVNYPGQSDEVINEIIYFHTVLDQFISEFAKGKKFSNMGTEIYFAIKRRLSNIDNDLKNGILVYPIE